jgi:hypothetical protein
LLSLIAKVGTLLKSTMAVMLLGLEEEWWSCVVVVVRVILNNNLSRTIAF